MPFDAMPERRFDNDGDLLAKAQGIIRRRGWAKGVYVNKFGGICAVTGIAVACGIERVRRPTDLQRRLARHLVRELPHCGGRFLRWYTTAYFRVKLYNDSKYTSFDDVMEMFDRAIRRQDEKVWAVLTSELKGAAF